MSASSRPLRRCKISDSVDGVSTSTFPRELLQRRLRGFERRGGAVHVGELRARDLRQPHAAE
jgi:hypothetical protein